jgi:hypothetical protein
VERYDDGDGLSRPVALGQVEQEIPVAAAILEMRIGGELLLPRGSSRRRGRLSAAGGRPESVEGLRP